MELINGSNVAAVAALEMAVDLRRRRSPHALIGPLVARVAEFTGDYEATDRLVDRLAREASTPESNALLEELVAIRDARPAE